MTHLLLYGNAYAQIIRNGKGQVIGLYPLMPNRMTVDRDEHGHLYYQYQMQESDAQTMKAGTVTLRPSDVLHVPGLGFDGLVGYSPIAMAKNAIGLPLPQRNTALSSLQTELHREVCWNSLAPSRIQMSSAKAGTRAFPVAILIRSQS